VRSIVSTTACDGRDLPALDDAFAVTIADAWAGHGLRLEMFRPATDADLATAQSSWARRLGLGGRAAAVSGRQPWVIELRRAARGGEGR
jgi:hypothetical protein